MADTYDSSTVRGGDAFPVQIKNSADHSLPVESTGSGKTLKSAPFSLSASGNAIAGVAAKVLKVFSYTVQSANDGMTIKFTDDNGGNQVSQLWTLNTREGAIQQAVAPPSFFFKSAVGKPVYAVITGTGTLNGCLYYWDDDAS